MPPPDAPIEHTQPSHPQQEQLFDAGSSWPLLPDANGGHVPPNNQLDFSAMSRTPSTLNNWDGAGEFGILS